MSSPISEPPSSTKFTKCQICEREFTGPRGLAGHVVQKHKIDKIDYYNKYINVDPNSGKCLTCGSQTRFRTISEGFVMFCSIDCMYINPDILKKKSISAAKAHKRNPEQTKRTAQKAAETMRKNPHLLEQANKKRAETLAADLSIQARMTDAASIGLREYYAKLRLNADQSQHFIYLMEHLSLDIVKIGITSNINNRISKLRRIFGPLKVIKSCTTTYSDAVNLEVQMHRHFKSHCKVQPQSGGGRTEFFNSVITDEAIAMLEEFESSMKV